MPTTTTEQQGSKLVVSSPAQDEADGIHTLALAGNSWTALLEASW
jgi:hypothetical protein